MVFIIIFSSLLALLTNCIFFILSLAPGSFPNPLTAKEEEEYLNRLADGDESAREVLIERNLRLVAHVIKKYYTNPQEQEDLISIGSIGLIKAINSYKPGKGTRLATYAARCIENEILMHFRATKKLAVEVSLSDVLDTDSDGGSLSLIDVISTDDIRLDRIENMDTEEALYNLINTCLDAREREIIIERYGLYGTIPKTQNEIAKKSNISRSYVSRIEKRALEKLYDGFTKK